MGWVQVRPARARLLLVDDDKRQLDSLVRALKPHASSLDVRVAEDARSALTQIDSFCPHLVLLDVLLPGGDGIELCRTIKTDPLSGRTRVVVVSGYLTVEREKDAMNAGALRVESKPIDLKAVLRDVGIMEVDPLSGATGLSQDRAATAALFDSALERLVLHFQPIVSWSRKCATAYEVLVRSTEGALARPLELFAVAEHLIRTRELSRRIRSAAAQVASGLPPGLDLYVNLHRTDLDDEILGGTSDPLSRYASRVVLELSEATPFDRMKDVRGRIDELRAAGYRVALDDLGAGKAGLTALAALRPDVVKIDMSLVRGSDDDPLRCKLISSIAEICREFEILVVPEGIETHAERDAVLAAGCDLLQGYLFGKPDKAMLPPRF